MTSSMTTNPDSRPEAQAHDFQPDLASSDPYAVLGLRRGASLRQVKRAYFALVRQYPPEEQPQTFKLIRAAYEKLRTAETQAETDLFLFQPPPPWQPRKRQGKLDLTFDPADVYRYLQTTGDLGLADFEADFRPIRL